MAINAPVLLTSLSVYAVVWFVLCRSAGLVVKTESYSDTQFRLVLKKILDPIGWAIKNGGIALAILSAIFIVGWSYLHFLSGGPERNMKLVGAEFAKSLPGTNPELSLSDKVNLFRSSGISPDENMALQILKIVKPQGNPALKEETLEEFARSSACQNQNLNPFRLSTFTRKPWIRTASMLKN